MIQVRNHFRPMTKKSPEHGRRQKIFSFATKEPKTAEGALPCPKVEKKNTPKLALDHHEFPMILN
jgi:hypothetical protein